MVTTSTAEKDATIEELETRTDEWDAHVTEVEKLNIRVTDLTQQVDVLLESREKVETTAGLRTEMLENEQRLQVVIESSEMSSQERNLLHVSRRRR